MKTSLSKYVQISSQKLGPRWTGTPYHILIETQSRIQCFIHEILHTEWKGIVWLQGMHATAACAHHEQANNPAFDGRE